MTRNDSVSQRLQASETAKPGATDTCPGASFLCIPNQSNSSFLNQEKEKNGIQADYTFRTRCSYVACFEIPRSKACTSSHSGLLILDPPVPTFSDLLTACTPHPPRTGADTRAGHKGSTLDFWLSNLLDHICCPVRFNFIKAEIFRALKQKLQIQTRHFLTQK